MDGILFWIYTLARYAVAGAFALACLLALGYWAIRRRKIEPFGGLARAVRAVGDPVVVPLERRVLRMGGNPQDAPVWLVGIVVVGGLLALGLLSWIQGLVGYVRYTAVAGPRAWVTLVINAAFFVLMTALIVRVIGSWFGMGRYHRIVGVTYRLTDWLVEPIRRVLPPFGPFDMSPIVAYLVLWLGRTLLLGFLR